MIKRIVKLAQRVEGADKLPRGVVGTIALLSIALALACYLSIASELPEAAHLARGGLSLMFAGAMLGYLLLLDTLCKLWRTRNFVPEGPSE